MPCARGRVAPAGTCGASRARRTIGADPSAANAGAATTQQREQHEERNTAPTSHPAPPSRPRGPIVRSYTRPRDRHHQFSTTGDRWCSPSAARLSRRRGGSDRGRRVRGARRRSHRSAEGGGPGRHEAPARARAGAGARRQGLDQLAAAHAGRAARQGRALRLLDVLVHQLRAHVSVPAIVVRPLPRRRARGRRHPLARVRLREGAQATSRPR